MYRSILVPLDGSPLSEHAVSTAATIAQGADATVHLVRVHLQQVTYIAGAMPLLDTPADRQQREAEESYLDGVARQLREHAIHARTTVLDGSVATALQDYVAVARHAIDLTVMIIHGRSGVPHLWFGSVADQFVRALPTPVLLSKPHALHNQDHATHAERSDEP